jgi:hypothetical protein
MHFGHLLATDPPSCYVAEDHGHVVAFGILMCRGGDAFLSFLFVTPRWQGRRLGRALLEACLSAGGPVARLSTCAEADQPVSTGLYASLGMAPRTPLYLLRGTLAESDLPGLPATIRRVPLDTGAAAALDREVLGYERPQDHALWRRERQAALFLDETGGVAGYGYAHPSGRVGPVAAREPALLPSLVGSLLAITPVLEGRQVLVPGRAIEVLRPLLAAGARIDGTPAIYCSSGASLGFDRYLPMSFALL